MKAIAMHSGVRCKYPSQAWIAIFPALGNGSFQFTFTNASGVTFTLLATTNPALPLSNWSVLGPATESPPGQFQFNDPQAVSNAHRFYRARSP